MPSSSFARPRSITREPNPFRDGGVTGGPSFSRQCSISRRPLGVGSIVHSIRIDPFVIGKRTVFHGIGREFVERDAKGQGRFGGKRMFSPVITMRSVRPSATPNGSKASLSTSSSPALCQFSRVNRLCDRESANNLASTASRITLGSEFVRDACQTIDCTVASVFFTR